MLDRRDFTAMTGGAVASAALNGGAWAQGVGTIPFYVSAGPELALFQLDVAGAALVRQGSVTLPANVQYAWPHPSKKYLYVVSSNGQASGGAKGSRHFANVFAVDPGTGALAPLGQPLPLAQRPIHVSLDHTGRFALIAYNDPSNLTVHPIGADGALGAAIPQQHKLDTGIYAHQVRMPPSDQTAILVTRGISPTGGQPEYPGAIKLFKFEGGQLSNLASIAPGGSGYGFGPRHLDFHPSLPRVYVSLERENRLYVYGLTPEGGLTAEPLFKRESLAAGPVAPVQIAGPIHVHPGGRFVYQANRGSGTVDIGGRRVSDGGRNDIAVYAIDPKTGAPTLIQNADAHGFEVRTFAIDPSGRLLLAVPMQPLAVRQGDAVAPVAAGIAVYRIGADGRLDFVRKYDVDTAAGTLFWSGLLTMA